MSIKIYNSLTRKKDDLEPLKKGSIKIYVCGPTVYDEPHIGHARSAYIFEVIRRYLEHKKLKVTFVKNVTDVDDKIIEKAKKAFPGEDLNEAVKKVSDKYLKAYHRDMEALGIRCPDKEPKATEYIGKMIGFIEKLIERNAAYVSDGDVYFDIKKAKNYGKLSGQSLDKMEAGARVSSGENKKDALDFALWKKAKENEPSWDSPWGKGRPGWHIECSAMSSDILGDEFDIHGGGIDLIFPHHENEIAQSEAAGKKFARTWIHHGLLTINSQKMAKSLGNFITIKVFVSKNDLDILKLFFLGTHCSNPIDFTEEKIEQAKKQKKSFDYFFKKVELLVEGKKIPEFSTQNKKQIDAICDKFEQAMDNDFNTPQALGYLFELRDLACGFAGEAFKYSRPKLEILFNIFGLKATPPTKLVKEVTREDVIKREEFKKEGKFDKADEIRKKWEKLGLNTSDTNFGIAFTEIE